MTAERSDECAAVWTPPRPGDCIAGKYQVEQVLGRGGMGIVLAARHIQLKSRVAIKVLSPQALRMPGAVERFMREGQAAASLRSEHVGRVMDVATMESGAPYLVMELLEGSDLQALLKKRGRLPLDESIDYLLQTCEAIREAHEHGIIHRDLKPANLFVTTRLNGRPLLKVLDFGLAKVLDEARATGDAALTATGVAAGSPFYMAPEQIRGLKLADARSDVWSLGVIAYELFTGQRPFRAHDAMGVLAVILTEEPRPPRLVFPELPAELEEVVLRCLLKNPTERLQSVRELAEGFDCFAAQRESEGAAVSIEHRTHEVVTVPRAAARHLTIARTSPVGTGSSGTVKLVVDGATQSRSAGIADATSQTTLTVGASEVQARAERSGGRPSTRAALGLAAGALLVALSILLGTQLAPLSPGAGVARDTGTTESTILGGPASAERSVTIPGETSAVPPAAASVPATSSGTARTPPWAPREAPAGAPRTVPGTGRTAESVASIAATVTAAPSVSVVPATSAAPAVSMTATAQPVSPPAPAPAPDPPPAQETTDPSGEWR